MKKILFFICTLDDGGAQRVVSTLSSKMVERGFDVEVLKYYDSENIYSISDKVIINSVIKNTKTKNILTNLSWMRKYFKDNADVVISFLAPYNILALLANRGNNVPIIVADRNDPSKVPSSPIIRKLRDLLYEKADGIVLQTSDNKQYFSKSIQAKSTIIKNPFEQRDIFASAIFMDKCDLIVSVGRLEPQKNQEMLIKAFDELKDKYSTYKLVIYGEGNYRDYLQKTIDKLNLEDRVLLPGSKKDVLDQVKEAKLFVLSSNYEGMSNALVEAMCLGLPVISTKVSGAKDLIRNNDNGILVDVNNKKQLVEAIDKMLSDDDFRTKCSVNASEIYKEFDTNIITNQWIDFINKVK